MHAFRLSVFVRIVPKHHARAPQPGNEMLASSQRDIYFAVVAALAAGEKHARIFSLHLAEAPRTESTPHVVNSKARDHRIPSDLIGLRLSGWRRVTMRFSLFFAATLFLGLASALPAPQNDEDKPMPVSQLLC